MESKKTTRTGTIKDLKAGSFLTIGKIKPSGSLQARKLSSAAVVLYWRYTFGGKTERVLLGTYDSSLPPKSLEPTEGRHSILSATRAAEHLAAAHSTSLPDGGHAALAKKKADEKARVKADHATRKTHTLERLVLAYCDHLKRLGRAAHLDARSIFTLHLIRAWPDIAALPASDVTDEQVADMLRRVFELGKGRTANKLRSYLRAAYEVARKARTDPKVSVTFKAFNVRLNPAAATSADAASNKADKDPLTTKQMRAYWKCIEKAAGFRGALLRLHLLTGGQRIEQLVRVKTDDVSTTTLLIFDGKGRPGKPPRPHPLPLIPAAAKTFKVLKPTGDYALSTDGGTTHVSASTLSQWAADAATNIDGFQTKRLRSGVETLLASAGISKDTRGRLQSHGITGVQAAHYDAHDYMPEKRQALEVLFRELTTEKESRKKSA